MSKEAVEEHEPSALEKLLADYPKLPLADEMRVKLGDVHLSLKHFARAQAAYGAVPANSPYRDIAGVGTARALLGLKKYPDAIKACEAVLAAFKETPVSKGRMLPEQCTYIIGLAHFNQNQHDKAADAFARLLDKVRQGPMAEDAAQLALFGGVTKARFRHQVQPGDQLRLEAEILRRKGAIGKVRAEASVNGKVVADAELTFALADAGHDEEADWPRQPRGQS